MVFSISLCIPYQWDKLDYSAVRRPLHLSEREHGRLCFASALCSSLGMREALLITITQGLRSTELLSSQMLLANMVEGGKENPCGVSKCQLNSSHWNLETIICINKYLYETSLDQCYNKGGGEQKVQYYYVSGKWRAGNIWWIALMDRTCFLYSFRSFAEETYTIRSHWNQCFPNCVRRNISKDV